MKTRDCLALMGTVLASTTAAAPEKTGLGRTAGSVLVMAKAYQNDGGTFLGSDDCVNALASAWYGYGWLHFGIAYGLLKNTVPAGCPFASPAERLPPVFRDRLTEKTGRYARLLDTARHAIRPSPEEGTLAADFAARILLVVSIYAGEGTRCLTSGAIEDALARFSYAHGWIDAGVTAGLFHITDNRDLFTV